MVKLDHILDRKMTRKEFLGTIGLGVVALFGLSSLMGILSGSEKTPQATGYGTNLYSGSSDEGA